MPIGATPRWRWSGVRSRHSVCVGRRFGRVSRRPRQQLDLRVWVAPSRVRPSCPRAASDCVAAVETADSSTVGHRRRCDGRVAPVGGTISRSHSTCVGVYCSSVVPGRYRLCCRAPPPWRPATPPGRPARRRRGHLPRWTCPEPNWRGTVPACSGATETVLAVGMGERNRRPGVLSHPCFKVIRFAPSGAWVRRLIPVLSPGRRRARTS